MDVQGKPGFQNQLFQLSMMAITIVALYLIIYSYLKVFNSNDPLPELHPMSLTDKLKDPNARALQVGLFIDDFFKFDIIKNFYKFSGIVFFDYDPKVVSLDQISNFSLEKGTITYKSQPEITSYGDRNIAKMSVVGEFTTNINDRMFPISDHRISMVLVFNSIKPNTVLLESSIDRFIINPSVHTIGWKEFDRIVQTGYSASRLVREHQIFQHSRPRAAFTVDYARDGYRELISIFLPIFILFFVAIFSITLDPNVHLQTSVALSVGAFTGLLAYKYVIDRLSPEVGYFMLSDAIFFLVLLLTIMIFIINVEGQNISMSAKRKIVIAFHGILIFGVYYLVNYF